MQGLPFGCNVVTSNLLKCKSKMIDPYYKMLSLVCEVFIFDSMSFDIKLSSLLHLNIAKT